MKQSVLVLVEDEDQACVYTFIYITWWKVRLHHDEKKNETKNTKNQFEKKKKKIIEESTNIVHSSVVVCCVFVSSSVSDHWFVCANGDWSSSTVLLSPPPPPPAIQIHTARTYPRSRDKKARPARMSKLKVTKTHFAQNSPRFSGICEDLPIWDAPRGPGRAPGSL